MLKSSNAPENAGAGVQWYGAHAVQMTRLAEAECGRYARFAGRALEIGRKSHFRFLCRSRRDAHSVRGRARGRPLAHSGGLTGRSRWHTTGSLRAEPVLPAPTRPPICSTASMYAAKRCRHGARARSTKVPPEFVHVQASVGYRVRMCSRTSSSRARAADAPEHSTDSIRPLRVRTRHRGRRLHRECAASSKCSRCAAFKSVRCRRCTLQNITDSAHELGRPFPAHVHAHAGIRGVPSAYALRPVVVSPTRRGCAGTPLGLDSTAKRYALASCTLPGAGADVCHIAHASRCGDLGGAELGASLEDTASTAPGQPCSLVSAKKTRVHF